MYTQSEIYNRLKARLQEAIEKDWQGRALDAVNDAFCYWYYERLITKDQYEELSAIYQAWENSWTDEN